ncbi:MAG: DJ-1/PfpI family protein [Nitrososphaerales archaeon]
MSYLNACIIVADQVQEEEFFPFYYRFQESFKLEVVYVGQNTKYNKRVGKYGMPIPTTMNIEDITNPSQFAEQNDILYIPGGIVNAELLRANEETLILCQQFAKKKKVTAVICHGIWPLISADLIRGKKCTAFPAIRADLVNAGGVWSDEKVVVDDLFVSAQHYRDNPKFMKTVLDVYFDRYTPEHYQG